MSECHLAILQSHVEKSWYRPLLIVFLTEPWMLINDLQTGKDSVGGGSKLDTVLTAIWMTLAVMSPLDMDGLSSDVWI